MSTPKVVYLEHISKSGGAIPYHEKDVERLLATGRYVRVELKPSAASGEAPAATVPAEAPKVEPEVEPKGETAKWVPPEKRVHTMPFRPKDEKKD